MHAPAGDAPVEDPALEALKLVPSAVVKRVAPLDVPITDEEVLAHIDEGLELKGKGDMQGALTHFRAALKKLPDHPKLLYHTARTLDIMGLTQKAAPMWKTLFQLGPGTGDLYIFARDRMADGTPVINEPEEEKEGKFTIKDLKEVTFPESAAGERVRLTVVVKKNIPENVDLQREMLLVTHFFDSVNGRRVARSLVDQPEVVCLSAPIDWADGTETFSFDYWQPAMTPEQLVKFGRCRYYGCALDVFYKDKLQDCSATAGDLVKMAHTLPQPAPSQGDSLLNTAPDGQEPSLFPPVLKER